MEIEVRFGLACMGLEMGREMGKFLEQHIVSFALSGQQLTEHENMSVVRTVKLDIKSSVMNMQFEQR